MLAEMCWAKSLHDYPPDSVGLFIGTSTHGSETVLNSLASDHPDYCSSIAAIQAAIHKPDLLALVRQRLDIRGASGVLVTSCTSAALAIGQALMSLAIGETQACVVGGIDTLTPLTVAGFSALQLLDGSVSRPFSPHRAGVNLGEGAAFFLLEAHPKNRPIGFLRGIGITTDPSHHTSPDPSGHPMAKAMILALEAADCSPDDIIYINTHGTGTQSNDSAEWRAMVSVYGESRLPSWDEINNFSPHIPIVVAATKPWHGHCLGAGPAIELAVTLESLTLLGQTKGRSRLLGCSHSFGFGGSCVSLVVEGGL